MSLNIAHRFGAEDLLTAVRAFVKCDVWDDVLLIFECSDEIACRFLDSSATARWAVHKVYHSESAPLNMHALRISESKMYRTHLP